ADSDGTTTSNGRHPPSSTRPESVCRVQTPPSRNRRHLDVPHLRSALRGQLLGALRRGSAEPHVAAPQRVDGGGPHVAGSARTLVGAPGALRLLVAALP